MKDFGISRGRGQIPAAIGTANFFDGTANLFGGTANWLQRAYPSGGLEQVRANSPAKDRRSKCLRRWLPNAARIGRFRPPHAAWESRSGDAETTRRERRRCARPTGPPTWNHRQIEPQWPKYSFQALSIRARSRRTVRTSRVQLRRIKPEAFGDNNLGPQPELRG